MVDVPASAHVQELASTADAEAFLTSEGAAVLLAYRPGCGPCIQYKPRFNAIAEAAHAQGVAVRWGRFNAMTVQAPAALKPFGAFRLPSVFLKPRSADKELRAVPQTLVARTHDAMLATARALSVE